MKNCRGLLLACCLAAACTPVAKVEGVLPAGVDVEVKAQDISAYTTVCTRKTDAAGRFRCRLAVRKGEPEFFYFYAAGRPVASLVLAGGESVRLEADTLGHCTIAGSPESVLLQEVETARRRFLRQMEEAPSLREQSALYLAHYREDVRFLMEHPTSLAAIPVLFEKWENGTPMLNQATDAILCRSICDSLGVRYPQSKYVRALDAEASRRERQLSLQTRLDVASRTRCPALEMPDIGGKTVSVLDLPDKVVLIHFWDSGDVAQKMFNLDVLLPLYREFHDRGLEIYAVAVNADKSGWARTVRAQQLPWINVNDGLGTRSAAVLQYNLASLPASFLLAEEGLVSPAIAGGDALRKELQKLL
ncbi:MAG: TlpA family protein disulfide reductase [Bacteroidales bacterium]|nr:TlpA family protein disulfide reductase [Bacteroidales bacterium]